MCVYSICMSIFHFQLLVSRVVGGGPGCGPVVAGYAIHVNTVVQMYIWCIEGQISCDPQTYIIRHTIPTMKV